MNFNYGIDCEDDKKARKLWQFIAGLSMHQDGLVLSEERVSVTASQALLDELRVYAPSHPGDLRVEVWPGNQEYDDAESAGALETHELQGKASRRTAASGPSRYRTYAGSREHIEAFKVWLGEVNPIGIEMTEQWEPQIEAGSYGVEFRCDDPKFDKTANQEWVAKGVVTEKLRR